MDEHDEIEILTPKETALLNTIADQQAEIDRLRTEKEKREEKDANNDYADEWRWRHIRKLTKVENSTVRSDGGVSPLPVPRLEIRWREVSEFTRIAEYGLVYRHFLGDIMFVPFSSTRQGGSHIPFDTPFRDGAHIRNDSVQLSLPAYVVDIDGGAKQLDTSKPC